MHLTHLAQSTTRALSPILSPCPYISINEQLLKIVYYIFRAVTEEPERKAPMANVNVNLRGVLLPLLESSSDFNVFKKRSKILSLTRTSLPVSGPVSRQEKALRMTAGPRATTYKREENILARQQHASFQIKPPHQARVATLRIRPRMGNDPGTLNHEPQSACMSIEGAHSHAHTEGEEKKTSKGQKWRERERERERWREKERERERERENRVSYEFYI